jgi:AraC-like DNA-binding protein
METQATASHRGILNPAAARTRFTLSRHRPAPDLAFFVERHWIVTWDLRGREPHLQQTLPHPCVNMVIEPDRARVYGVETARSGQLLRGRGRALGTKFRVGAFRPFVDFDIAELTGRSIAIDDVFGAVPEPEIGAVEAFLRERLPVRDDNVALIAEMARAMLDDPALTRVEDLVRQFGLSARTLQRLFRRYVGVGPKWVLQRYRLHEAAERIADGEGGDWAAFALELGYFDQAHFIKDFKALVGCSPAEYAAICASVAAAA